MLAAAPESASCNVRRDRRQCSPATRSTPCCDILLVPRPSHSFTLLALVFFSKMSSSTSSSSRSSSSLLRDSHLATLLGLRNPRVSRRAQHPATAAVLDNSPVKLSSSSSSSSSSSLPAAAACRAVRPRPAVPPVGGEAERAQSLVPPHRSAAADRLPLRAPRAQRSVVGFSASPLDHPSFRPCCPFSDCEGAPMDARRALRLVRGADGVADSSFADIAIAVL